MLPSSANRRVLCIWLPRLGAERLLRRGAEDEAGAPFATVAEENGAQRLASLGAHAEAAGLRPGMPLADARAVSPGLRTAPADEAAESAFLRRLARWAGRYSPWVGLDGADGLALDISGCAHLFGGEDGLLAEIAQRLAGMRLTALLGLADGKGTAWALARFAARSEAPARIAPGANRTALAPLPPAALRLAPEVVDALLRLGFTTVAALAEAPRGAISRRFGAETLRRLDQAFAIEPEPVTPLRGQTVYAARLSLPDPIGLRDDMLRALDRLLARLAMRLEADGLGARRLALKARRVDHREIRIEVGLARPSRDVAIMRALFEKPLDDFDAGFGVDALRLEAEQAEPMQPRQMESGDALMGHASADDRPLAELLSRLGARIGFDRLTRLAPGEAHPPDRAVLTLAAAYSEPAPNWPSAAAQRPPRPLSVFAPEPISPPAGMAADPRPPERFRWRGRDWRVLRAEGPERIAPEWWLDDPAWRDGLRDYWRVEAAPEMASSGQEERQRLWLYHLPERARAALLDAEPDLFGDSRLEPPPCWRVVGVFA